MAAVSRTLMALAIAATMVVQLAMAANYTVADSDGWELGSDFQSWVASKNFTVGDVITFVYTESHNVLEVSEPDFSSCSASNPIEQHTGGSTAITLLTSGKRFFICGVPGHCTAGMKVEIDTLATPSPPPSSTDTPPAPPPKVTPSSPPPSSSSAPPPKVTPSSPPPSSSPAAPTSPPASPPKAATKPPAKSPVAPAPGSKASPPAPPAEPTPPSQAPTPEPPIPPFPFDQPIIPSAAPATPPPPPSSAHKCSFRVHLSVGFSFVVMMLMSL